MKLNILLNSPYVIINELISPLAAGTIQIFVDDNQLPLAFNSILFDIPKYDSGIDVVFRRRLTPSKFLEELVDLEKFEEGLNNNIAFLKKLESFLIYAVSCFAGTEQVVVAYKESYCLNILIKELISKNRFYPLMAKNLQNYYLENVL